MKNFKKLAMLGAVALTSTVLFTACSSDEDVALNPTYDGSTVKTTFTISVGDVKNTRMATTAVQADNAFQGLTDIYLFPAKATITSATAFSEGYINLPEFAAFDNESGQSLLNANGKRYKDVSFSMGVSDFLFYAAIYSSKKGNGELKPSYLALEANDANFVPAWAASSVTNATTAGDITFDLVPYQKGKGISDVKTAGADIATLVTTIYGLLRDKAAAATSASVDAVATKLGGLRDKMKNLNAENAPQAFAGSSLSVKELIEDIYNSIFIDATTLASLDATTQSNYNTYYKPIAEAIAGVDGTPFQYTLTNNVYELSWRTDPDFPKTALGLPDGAVALLYNASDDNFDYTTASMEGLSVPTIDRYTHPARLYYTINTPAMTKDAAYLYTNDVDGKTWTQIQDVYQDAPVSATTQSVIMKKQVEYAVARLDVQAQIKESVTIRDAGSGVDGAADENPQPVAVPSAGYTITGVLIGGQKQVDWEFHPTTDSDAPVYTIYDGVMTSNTAATVGAWSSVNHTLALETAANEVINIAVEFVNTGKDFYGINNKLIPAGSKFYLVARLDPTGKSINQVFKQDYTTTAKLTIDEDALASAYNVIPDLRSPKLEFGLSVNLDWKTGVTYEQNFQ